MTTAQDIKSDYKSQQSRVTYTMNLWSDIFYTSDKQYQIKMFTLMKTTVYVSGN
jgi:hypothetical protein